MEYINSNYRVFVDEKRMKVIKRERKRKKICKLWDKEVEDRKWNGKEYKDVEYVFEKGRGKKEIK